jgi:nitrate/nitrite transporter NarK/transposase-like protein
LVTSPSGTDEKANQVLWTSTAAFTASFAVWTIFAIIGIGIKEELRLSESQFGLLVGTPILSGSVSRLFLGMWSDRYGGRKIFAALMFISAAATYALIWADSYVTMLLAGLVVGLAGGTFSVGVPYVSRFFSPERQGTALGIFGAGNVGAAVTKFLAPFVMVAMGWRGVAEVWAAGLAITAVLFLLLTRDEPRSAADAQAAREPFLAQFKVLVHAQVWRFSLYYFFVFGGFVALALWLPHYLVATYGLSLSSAGMLAAFYSVPASLFRIYGGVLSDRYGARAVLYWTFGVGILSTFMLSYPPTTYIIEGIREPIRFSTSLGLTPFLVIMFVLGFFMSLGKAAVFKHCPPSALLRHTEGLHERRMAGSSSPPGAKMKQTSGPVRKPAEAVIKDIRRATRRQFSAEEKIRIVLEGLRGEDSIAELCRREGIASSMYYGWSKEFLEAGKKRLAGDTARAATADEVQDLRREAGALKEVVADLVLENRLLKKSMTAAGGDEA